MSKYVACNICNSTDYKYYENVANDRKIVQCDKCGLVFTNPQPEFGELYKKLENEISPSECILKIEEDKYKIYLDEIESLRKNQKGRLLDVGFGFGDLLRSAKERGWQIFGVEFNKDRVDRVREQLGADLFCGELKEAKYSDNFFDVITIIEVLEHLSDPSNFLIEINRILKKDGLVAIVTPNVESYYAKVSPSWWTLHHLFHFSPKTLTKILKKNNFVPVKIVVNPHFETRDSELKFSFLRRNIFKYFRPGIIFVRKVLSSHFVSKLMGMHELIKTAGITIYAKKSS